MRWVRASNHDWKRCSYGFQYDLSQRFCRTHFDGGNVPALQNENGPGPGGELQIANDVSDVPCHHRPGRGQLPALREAAPWDLTNAFIVTNRGYADTRLKRKFKGEIWAQQQAEVRKAPCPSPRQKPTKSPLHQPARTNMLKQDWPRRNRDAERIAWRSRDRIRMGNFYCWCREGDSNPHAPFKGCGF